MDVPYELVFDFGGAQRSIKGIWKGAAVSEATFEVNLEACNMQCCLVCYRTLLTVMCGNSL